MIISGFHTSLLLTLLVTHLPTLQQSPAVRRPVTMVFSQILSFLSKKHVMVLNLVFFCMFCVQFGSLVKNTLDHTELSTVMRKESLESQDTFPLTAKLCVKPGFNQTELFKAGYVDALGYFHGRSRHSNYTIGWAGHTEDGGTLDAAGDNDIRLPPDEGCHGKL